MAADGDKPLSAAEPVTQQIEDIAALPPSTEPTHNVVPQLLPRPEALDGPLRDLALHSVAPLGNSKIASRFLRVSAPHASSDFGPRVGSTSHHISEQLVSKIGRAS